MNIISETERLLIREANLEDASFMVDLMNSEGWLKYIGERNVKSVPDAEKYIQERYMESYKLIGFGFWILIEKVSQKPIGLCGIVKRPFLEDVDLGYALLADYFGKGYAYEACKEVLILAKTKFNLTTLIAVLQADNKASVNLLKKLEFHYEKDSLFDDGSLLAQYRINL